MTSERLALTGLLGALLSLAALFVTYESRGPQESLYVDEGQRDGCVLCRGPE